jgi:hypothetical protein
MKRDLLEQHKSQEALEWVVLRVEACHRQRPGLHLQGLQVLPPV